ncbi:hypothetical protein [Pseudomonas sp. TH10]|uniref:hypothetical protein n=1 Tax=Pseudomonas sp. TH10 TaxID=2796376 RepID=UPI0019127ECD|nr:hypothetical protein [Pseudomonas sp. TH10]MBK5519140.1 hypothetical protein [Pseudomonas sp. TH10]
MIAENSSVARAATQPRSDSAPTRPIARALESVVNHPEVNLAPILSEDTIHTSDAAMRHLRQQACAYFMPGAAKEDVLKIASAGVGDGEYQVRLAVELFMLSKVPNIGTDKTFKQAQKLIQSALAKSVAQGVPKISLGKLFGHENRHERAVAINGRMDTLLTRYPDAELHTQNNLYNEYLHNGLVRATQVRLQAGERLTDETVREIRQSGNGREFATAALYDQMNYRSPSGSPSEHFWGVIQLGLGQLDLKQSYLPSKGNAGRNVQRNPSESARTPIQNTGQRLPTEGLNVTSKNGDMKIDFHGIGQAGASGSDLVEALTKSSVEAAKNNNESAERMLAQALRFTLEVMRVVNVGGNHSSSSVPLDITPGSQAQHADTGRIVTGRTSIVATAEQSAVQVIDDNVEDAQQHEAVNIATTGAQQLVQSSTISFSDSDESDADSGVGDVIPLPPAMPSPPKAMDQNIENHYRTNVMAELKVELAKRNAQAEADQIELPASPQPNRRASSLDIIRTEDILHRPTFDDRLSDNFSQRLRRVSSDAHFSRGVIDESQNLELFNARAALRQVGSSNRGASAARTQAALADGTRRENVGVSLDPLPSRSSTQVDTSADVMDIDQAQTLERWDSLSELTRLPSMVPFNARGKAKVHAPVDTSNSFYASLDSGTAMKGRPWQF